MTTFPDDEILLARGKYSTLGRERREQLKRMAKIATTVMASCSQAMRDCEAIPPVTEEPLNTIGKCLGNFIDCRNKLVEICGDMEALKPMAWDSGEE